MKTFYLIIDESGAKGYSKNIEKNPKEFGVMVGFLVPKNFIHIWRKKSDEHFKIHLQDEKVHITSLSNKEQEKLRNKLYQIFTISGINWYYSAIYTQGFHEGAFDTKELLHSKLFSMIFTKALYNLSLLKEAGDIKIHVISDTLNQGEIKIFKRNIQDLIKIFTNTPREKELTKYDKEKQTIIKAKSISKITEKDKNFPVFKDIKLEISIENSNLTFMADILANSVYYYIKEYIKEKNNYPLLNSKQAIEQHPLSNLVLGSPNELDKKALPDIYNIIYRKR